MRTVDVQVTLNKPVLVHFTKEELKVKMIDYDNKRVTVITRYLNDEGETSEDQSTIFEDEEYELLMSQSEEFPLGKPLNDCREEDVFYMLDKKRDNGTAS
ncbi:hypothetical protein [Niallia sp. NCCP-28]|uniref:hypothetical protein n=1 Tax=Niallia sp. NCCP-28 TaxID=2934712 RepID=UPI0020815261|nr:hypothetical protein [Niallia sp. NCCP-28]GKU81191.1 hypothetical protein NCCP28_05870 [Niallia sp. NCCP-28]